MYRKVWLLCIAAGFAACTTQNETIKEREKFPVIGPMMADTSYTKEYVARIQSIQNVEIRARIRGFIENIYVDEGMAVKAGQVLFRINSQEFHKELLKAKALVKTAVAELRMDELELQNVRTLASKSIISQTELDKALARVEAANARVEEAKANEASATISVSLAEIRAPFDGTIHRIPFKAGSLIDEGSLLTTLSNNTSVFAYFNISEKEYLDFVSRNSDRISDPVRLVLANGNHHKYKGAIETIDGEIDHATGNIAFRARFPNPDLLLKHGSTGKVILTTKLRQAMLVPQKSTFEVQGNLYVFVVDQTGTVRQRKILPGVSMPHLFAIQSGLSPTDKILLEGIQRVREGDKVDVEPVPFPTSEN